MSPINVRVEFVDNTTVKPPYKNCKMFFLPKVGTILLWLTFRAGEQLAKMSSGRYTHWNTEVILTNVVKPGGTVSVVDHPDPDCFVSNLCYRAFGRLRRVPTPERTV